jgi:hypothetical protein
MLAAGTEATGITVVTVVMIMGPTCISSVAITAEGAMCMPTANVAR